MIFFVWSLVSSAIEAARKRHIANFLRALLSQQRVTRNYEMLIWKHVRAVSRPGPSSSRLYRPNSEPKLDSTLVLQTQLIQVFSEKFESMRASEWRFCPSYWPTDEDSIFFIVQDEVFVKYSTPTIDGQEEIVPNYFKLHEKCDRLAVHRTMTKSLYACSFSMFVDLVDAFSEKLLIDENFRVVQISSMFAPPQQFEKPQGLRPELTTSTLSLASTSHQRPLPILQHLFWGDGTSQFLNGNFGSEGNLDSDFSLLSPSKQQSRRSSSAITTNNSRRRYRSCHSPDSDRNPTSTIDFGDFEEFRSLPRYLRKYHFGQPSPRMNEFEKPLEIGDNLQSLPRYIKQINQVLSSEDLISSRSESLQSCRAILPSNNGQQPTASDSFSSSLGDSELVEVHGKIEDGVMRSHFTMDELKMIDETDTDTLDSTRIEKPVETIKFAQITTRPPNGNMNPSNGNIKNAEKRNGNAKRAVPEIPTIELSKLPPVANRNQRSTSVVAECLSKNNRRRFSAFSSDTDRGRSVSPSFEQYQNRTLRGFTSAANPNRSLKRNSSTRRSNLAAGYEFLSSRKSTMIKPDSVLVYTGGDHKLYDDIRSRLSTLLPPDEITVFNVSIEALRKQPWIEKSTRCVILASTNNMDDSAWDKIQAYFNQDGKVIFVCQNKLLASVTHCDSSKEQHSLLRMAFGKDSRLKDSNKDFAKFLEKNLKSLSKIEHINETFRSKDVSVGANFTVVLKKEKESPLFLYMKNSGSLHASVLFSDATTEQLIAPGSNLLRDSLLGVGVKISEDEIPKLTKGILIAEYDHMIDNIQGLRLGEQIGSTPQLLIRRSEIVKEDGLPEATAEILPIEIVTREQCKTEPGCCQDFDFGQYFEQLTSKIGQVVVLVDIATTTMDICASITSAIPSLESFVVIANRQVKGKGRGGNEFISPKGSALFNFSFTIKKSSRFAKNIPVLQHVFCAALVEAARKLSGYPDFPLRIKWPNDLYYEKLNKVGGMLISCNTRDDAFQISIGCGINVNNEKPTICLNDMLPKDSENRISKEKLIAETLNRFQYYINDYEANGPSNFKKKYYEYWLHSHQEILLSDFNERVTIRGIDEYGYLEVRSKTNPDKIFSIGDDGNTFDMMKGLIRHKF